MSAVIQDSVVLAPMTWWKMGGPADHFALPATLEDLKEVMTVAAHKKWPVTVLGGGSNILISDAGVEGLVIGMKNLRRLSIEKTDGRLIVECLAGTPKSDITKIFLAEKLAPALFLCGLPGDVGGGVVMNAGVSEAIVPREFVEIVDEVTVFETQGTSVQEKRFQKSDLQWTYRHSHGWQPGVIAKVRMSWPLDPDPSIMTKVKDATRSRLKRQPLEFPSCGSVFKNPVGHKAGALIEGAGLKGFVLGGLQVSEKHANFIVNKESLGRAADALALIRHIQKVVAEKFSVKLEAEVQLVGRWP